jgi:hypothetical protein
MADSDQLDLLSWKAARDLAMAKVEENAGPEFAQLARDFVIGYLSERGPATGESISLACKEAGIRPHDDRAFGPVYMKLQRDKLIEKCGLAPRLRGHGTSGGNIWRITRGEL